MTKTKRDIKDYLHLYLGCEVSLNDAPSVTEKIGGFGYMFGEKYVLFEPKCKEGLPMDKIKLVLRPISDMTEEEKDECDSLTNKYQDVHPMSAAITIWAYRINWCLSKHFDIFGLIESGLAIDKTKQP